MDESVTYYVSVRFELTNKAYTFLTEDPTLKVGDWVAVETQRGLELGLIKSAPSQIKNIRDGIEIKPILHKASEEELRRYEVNKEAAKDAMQVCQKEADALNLDMHVISGEYTLDRSKITFTYLADDRVDFRELLKVLAALFRCRIDLRQVGARDKCKMVNGLGICGRTLCCASFISEFERVSINMAKNQLLALNAPKLSGHCDSLKCCLRFEDDAYKELRSHFPKLNAAVEYENELYRVTGMNVITKSCKLENREHVIYVDVEDLMAKGTFPKNEKRKAQDKHEKTNELQ